MCSSIVATQVRATFVLSSIMYQSSVSVTATLNTTSNASLLLQSWTWKTVKNGFGRRHFSCAVFILYLVHSHILQTTVTLSRPSYYVYFWRQFYPSCFLKKHLVYWELRLSMMQQSSIVLLLLYCLDFRILKEFVFWRKYLQNWMYCSFSPQCNIWQNK